MPKGLIETGYESDPGPHVSQSIKDYCSEEDSQPLRIKRRATSSSKKKHGKALSLKRRRRGGFSSKNSVEKDLPLKKQSHDAAINEESLGKVPVWKMSEAQLLAKIQRDGFVFPDYVRDKGSCIYFISKEEYEIELPAPPGRLKFDRDFPPENDDELIFHEIGYDFPPRGSNQPDLYRIALHAKSGEESDFVSLLNEIHCGDRFFTISVEHPFVFFAELNEEEAAKLRDVEGVANVFPVRDTVARC